MPGAAEVFVQRHVRPRAGRTLIVGSKVYAGREDRRKAYPDALGVDMLSGEGVDIQADLCERGLDVVARLRGTFAHVECCSVMEHATRPWVMASNLQRLLMPGGTLHLSVPFVWRVHAYPSDYWRFTDEAVKLLFPEISWKSLLYGDDVLHDKAHARAFRQPDFPLPLFARTEVFGFGVRR